MISEIDPLLRNDIKGTTDSEHVFYFLLSLRLRFSDHNLRELVAIGLNRLRQFCEQVDPAAAVGLNIVLTDGDCLVGSRLGRSLWQLRRERAYTCEICGRSHVHHDAGTDYRAIEIASEPISDDNWQELPDGVVYSVDEDHYLLAESLAKYTATVLDHDTMRG